MLGHPNPNRSGSARGVGLRARSRRRSDDPRSLVVAGSAVPSTQTVFERSSTTSDRQRRGPPRPLTAAPCRSFDPSRRVGAGGFAGLRRIAIARRLAGAAEPAVGLSTGATTAIASRHSEKAIGRSAPLAYRGRVVRHGKKLARSARLLEFCQLTGRSLRSLRRVSRLAPRNSPAPQQVPKLPESRPLMGRLDLRAKSGGDLLSQGQSSQVPSALAGLNFCVRNGNRCDPSALSLPRLCVSLLLYSSCADSDRTDRVSATDES